MFSLRDVAIPAGIPFSVIPAKRGEAGFSRTHLTCVRAAERMQRISLHFGQQQVLNGSRALRATQKLIAVSAPRAGDFSLLVQREVTKRKHARMARHPPCASRRHRRAPQLAGRYTTRLGLKHEARENPDSGCDARARHTGEIEHPCQGLWWGAHLPVARAEYRSPTGSSQASTDRARGAFLSARRVCERPVGRGTEEDVARSGVCFFWLLLARAIPGAGPAGALCAPNFAPGKIVFAQAKTNSTGSNLDSRRLPAGRGPWMVRVQSNLPWVSHPQVAFHHRRRRYKKDWIPAFAGMTAGNHR
jgi:hypothetical protein